MNTDKHRWNEGKLNALTKAIIGCAYRVSNKLGVGYFEIVYKNAMRIELEKLGLNVRQEVSFDVVYEGFVVGKYVADLIVEDCVLVEAKAVKALEDAHRAQCLNYMACSKLPVCLLINFGKAQAEIKRLVGPNFPSHPHTTME